MGEESGPIPARDIDLPLVGRSNEWSDTGLVPTGKVIDEQADLAGDGTRIRGRGRCAPKGRARPGPWICGRQAQPHGLGPALLDQVAGVEPSEARLVEHRDHQREELIEQARSTGSSPQGRLMR